MKNLEKLKRKESLFKDIVLRFAEESHCESKKVAAIAVKNSRIIATGINGTPEKVLNCDDYFRKEYQKNKISISYNEWIKTPGWREQHHQWSDIKEIHAEQNLICEASRNGINLSEVEIYISLKPCIHCAKLLAALKPKVIYYINDYDKSSDDSQKLLEECGIHLIKIE